MLFFFLWEHQNGVLSWGLLIIGLHFVLLMYIDQLFQAFFGLEICKLWWQHCLPSFVDNRIHTSTSALQSYRDWWIFKKIARRFPCWCKQIVIIEAMGKCNKVIALVIGVLRDILWKGHLTFSNVWEHILLNIGFLLSFYKLKGGFYLLKLAIGNVIQFIPLFLCAYFLRYNRSWD
jgi:hypothetical protein